MRKDRSSRKKRARKSEKESRHIVVIWVGRRGFAAKPIEKIGVGTFEERFVAFELRPVESGKIGFRERAEDEIGLPRPAMPGTIKEPFAARISKSRHLVCV